MENSMINKDKIKKFIYLISAVLIANIITLIGLFALVAVIFPD